LDIPRVLIPPYAGVLSALGMVVAPPVTDASQTVVHLGEGLDDHRLVAEYGRLAARTSDVIPYERTAATEAFADVRFRGQSYELTVRVVRPSVEHVREQFLAAYAVQYGRAPEGREIEIVTVRFRRYGRGVEVALPPLSSEASSRRSVKLIDERGDEVSATCLDRAGLLGVGELRGPALLIDSHATTYVPRGWVARARGDGIVFLTRGGTA
jgi:N-methylhydantoinase A